MEGKHVCDAQELQKQDQRKQDSESISEVWKKYKQDQSNQDLRNQLIEHYLHLVRSNAGRMYSDLSRKVDYDDLYSVGVFGLMNAIDSFDLERGIKFETYSTLRICGAMLDEVRMLDWVPRLVRRNSKAIGSARRAAEVETNRPVSDEKIADKMNLSPEEFERFKNKNSVTGLSSLNVKIVEKDTSKDLYVLDCNKDAKREDPTVDIQNRDLMRLVTAEMSQRDRLIIIMYYYESMTMKQIGESLGISESRVSQIQKKIIERLKVRLSERRAEFDGRE